MADPYRSTWLDAPDTLNRLLPCARKVISKAEGKQIVLDDAYLKGDAKAYQQAVASSLWIFLKEDESLQQKVAKYLLTDDHEGFTRCLCHEFIDARIDQRRTGTDTPFHAYYRHMRTVLSGADGINYKSFPRRSYYAWSQSQDLPLHDHLLDYQEWSPSSVPFSAIHDKPAMIVLSRHYWGEALKIIRAENLYSIRGLVAFIVNKYPLITVIESEADGGGEEDSEAPHRRLGESLIEPDELLAEGAWARQFPVLADSIIEIDLERIARDCAAQLSRTEKDVLCGLDNSSTLAEIAKGLRMKGPSNVSYHQQLAFAKLRRAWSLWGEPDSEHYAVEEEEQLIFFKKVISFCKEPDGCRDSGKEGRP